MTYYAEIYKFPNVESTNSQQRCPQPSPQYAQNIYHTQCQLHPREAIPSRRDRGAETTFADRTICRDAPEVGLRYAELVINDLVPDGQTVRYAERAQVYRDNYHECIVVQDDWKVTSRLTPNLCADEYSVTRDEAKQR